MSDRKVPRRANPAHLQKSHFTARPLHRPARPAPSRLTYPSDQTVWFRASTDMTYPDDPPLQRLPLVSATLGWLRLKPSPRREPACMHALFLETRSPNSEKYSERVTQSSQSYRPSLPLTCSSVGKIRVVRNGPVLPSSLCTGPVARKDN